MGTAYTDATGTVDIGDRTGPLLLSLVDSETGAPVKDAEVSYVHGAGEAIYVTGADGYLPTLRTVPIVQAAQTAIQAPITVPVPAAR